MQPEPGRVPTFTEKARRAQIVAATIETLAAYGLRQTSFVKVADRAGISPGLITYHFRTRKTLLQAVLDDIEQRLDVSMSGTEAPPESYTQALEFIITGHVLHCAAHPADMVARRELVAPRAEIDSHERAERGRQEFLDFLRQGQEHEFGAFDRETFTDSLFAVLDDVPRQLATRPDIEAEELARQLAGYFTRIVVADHG